MDTAQALAALKRTNFSSTAKLDSIWSDDRTFHVPDIHRSVLDALERTFHRLQQDRDTLGEVVRGPAGAGKTHLLGELRRRIGSDGYFVAFNLADLNDFWEMAALGYLDSLQRPDPNGKRQLGSVLEGYLRSLQVPEARLGFVDAQKTPKRILIDSYLAEGRRKLGREAREHQDVIRALFLFNAGDTETSDIGYSMLHPRKSRKRRTTGSPAPVLPAGISDIHNACKMAADMADHLRAAIAKNPLLRDDATALDPGALLSATQAGRTAVSVINFSGLQSDEDKQVFVNKLQMALFSWLKRHPAPVDRPINGLLVMDEAQNFVPSQRSTPCSDSTISLIAQARKYGLGMVLATQQPKGLHHSVISNCTTHVYGKMNSPAAISTIKELGQAKGASISDIAALERGQFYFSSESEPVPFRIKTPLCLSHHPAHPLSEEEVAERARGSVAQRLPARA